MSTRNSIDIVARLRGNIVDSLNRAAKATRALSAALNSADKNARRTSTGLSKIGSNLEKIGSSLPMLVGSGGLAIALKKTADTAFQAHAQMSIFRRTLGAFNQDVEDGVRKLNEIAQKLQVAPEQIAASASLMLRAGYDMNEVVTAFEAGAASALAAGKTVMSGVENVALALSTGLSIYLNYIGIAENIGPAIRRVIAAHKGASAEVVKAAQNQAALNIVLKATAQEVKALPTLLGGYQGAMNRLNVALFNLSKTLGDEVLPGLTALIVNVTSAIKTFNALPQYVKAFTVGLGGAAIAVTTLATALAGLRVVVGILGGPAGWIMLLVTALGGLANVLYNRAIPGVSEGKKALERLAEAAQDAKKSIHQTNITLLTSSKIEAFKRFQEDVDKLKQRFANANPEIKQFIEMILAAGRQGKAVEEMESIVRAIENRSRELQAQGKDIQAAPYLEFSGQLRWLKDTAVELDRVTSELEAYKKSAQSLLKQPPPPPNKNTSEAAGKYTKLLDEIINHPFYTGSYFRELNRELGRTPDLIDKIAEHTSRSYLSALRTANQDRAIESTIRNMVAKAYRELSTQLNRMDFPALIANSILAGTDEGAELLGRHYASKIAHGFDVGIKAAAAQMAASLEEGLLKRLASGSVDRNIEVATREAAVAADNALRAYQAWLQTLDDLDKSIQGYAAELDEATYVTARYREEAERLLEPGSAMSPDTWDRLQSRLEGVNNKLRESVRYIHTLYSAGAVKTALSPDAMERNAKHAALIQRLLEEIADALREDQVETDKFGARMAAVVDAVSMVRSTLDHVFDAMEASARGDGKGFFSSMNAAIANLAEQIPVVGNLISSAVRLFSSLIQRFWDSITDPTGARRAEKSLNEVAERFTWVKKSALEAAKEIKRVWRRTWLFGGEEMEFTVINEQMLRRITSIAQAIESGVSSALRSGIMAFLHGDTDWREKLRKGIRDAIYNAIIEAVIQAGIIQGLLAEQLSKLTAALAAENWEAARKILADIDSRIDEIGDKVVKIFSGFKFPDAGNTGGEGDQSLGIYYNLPSTPIIATPPWVDQMGRAIDKFDEAVDRMLAREQRSDTWLGWFTRGAVL